jgi:hypothetical protein
MLIWIQRPSLVSLKGMILGIEKYACPVTFRKSLKSDFALASTGTPDFLLLTCKHRFTTTQFSFFDFF